MTGQREFPTRHKRVIELAAFGFFFDRMNRIYMIFRNFLIFFPLSLPAQIECLPAQGRQNKISAA